MRSLKHETMTIPRDVRTGPIGASASQSALGDALEPETLQSKFLIHHPGPSNGDFLRRSLNNDAVIKLVKAGLSDDLIVSTISKVPGTYDTSADGLTALRTEGASERVVGAIVARDSIARTATPAQTSTVPDPAPAAPAPQPRTPAAPAAQDPANQPLGDADNTNRPRLYLDSQNRGGNPSAGLDRSMEIAKNFQAICPDVRITISQKMADYTLLLSHVDRGLILQDNRIRIANKSGDLISWTKEGGI